MYQLTTTNDKRKFCKDFGITDNDLAYRRLYKEFRSTNKVAFQMIDGQHRFLGLSLAYLQACMKKHGHMLKYEQADKYDINFTKQQPTNTSNFATTVQMTIVQSDVKHEQDLHDLSYNIKLSHDTNEHKAIDTIAAHRDLLHKESLLNHTIVDAFNPRIFICTRDNAKTNATGETEVEVRYPTLIIYVFTYCLHTISHTFERLVWQ